MRGEEVGLVQIYTDRVQRETMTGNEQRNWIVRDVMMSIVIVAVLIGPTKSVGEESA